MPLDLLANNEVEAIHQATLRILSEVGVVLTESMTCQLLYQAGATIQQNRVLLPPELVESCIQKAGKSPSIRGRRGKVKTLGDGNLYFHNLGGAPQVYDAA